MILLISLKTLKDFYTFDDNIEDKYLIPNIQKGQDFIIKPILGTVKYDELIGQVKTDSVTSENSTLLEMIQPVLAYFVMAESIYSTAYKLKNLPVTETNPTTSRFEELIKLSAKWRKDSEAYQQLLKEWICDNNSVKDTEGQKFTFKTGIYID